MKLFIRRLQIYFYKPQRLIVASAVAVITFFIIAIGWIQVTKVAKRRINQAVTATSRKLNMPIDVRKIRVTPRGATLENIVIGLDSNVVISQMTAEVGLNPFNENFGKLDNLTIHSVRVKSPSENARSAISGLRKRSTANKPTQGAQVSALITRFFDSMPSNSLTMRSAGITLVDNEGRAVFAGKGLKLHLNKQTKKILFRADSVRASGGIFERNLQGRFQYSSRKNQFQFFAKRKSAKNTGQDIWSVSGTANADLTTVNLNTVFKSVPTFLAEQVKKITGDTRGLKVSANLVLRKKSSDKVEFSASVLGKGLIINNPVISTDAVGHIRYNAETAGTIDIEQQTVDFRKIILKIPTRTSGKYWKNSPRITGQMTASLTSSEPPQFKANGHFSMEATPCQMMIDSSPKGLTPNLDDFKLSGFLSAGITFRMDTEKPEDLFFDVTGASYSCQVVKAPYSFTKEHLNGAFTLQREVKGSSDPVEISVNPFSDDYTPIESIAKTVNLALVTSEDNAFFQHKGIDLFALENAVHRNFTEKRIAVGGSTITMQTVKNLYLGNERTISRKIQEFFLAWHLEKILDKNRILEIYVNIVEFGPGVYGITNAAQHFFGKHPFDLNLVESAYLASVLPSPTNRYQNFCNGKLSTGFKDMVYGLVKRMVNLNKIPYERYANAMGLQLEFNNNTRRSAWGCPGPGSEDL